MATDDDVPFSEECVYNLNEMPIEWRNAARVHPVHCFAASAVLVDDDDDDDMEFRSDHSLSDLDCDECTDSVYAVAVILRRRFASKEKRKRRRKTGFVDFHLGMDTPGKVLGCEVCHGVLSHDTFKTLRNMGV